jgi:hypothetical protein
MTQSILSPIWNIDKKLTIRHEELDGREYVVVPMSMILEGVHAGSQGPIYYSKEELSKTPKMWNMKPILVYHPKYGDTATDLRIYKSQAIGMIMGTEWKNGKLKAEAWLDKEKVNKIEPDILESIERGEPMEVSTGLFADCVLDEGDWNGEHYTAVAQNIRADHLAILPNKDGACSVEDGAGLLVNQAQQQQQREQKMTTVLNADKDIESKLSGMYGKKAVLKEMIEKSTSDEERAKLQSQYDALDAEVKKLEGTNIQNIQNESLTKIAEAVMSIATTVKTGKEQPIVNNKEDKVEPAQETNVTNAPIAGTNKPKVWSDNLLREELSRLLHVSIPETNSNHYIYITDIFPTFLIYTESIKGIQSYYKRSYAMNEDGTITLNDDIEPVIMETKYKTKDGTVLNALTLPIPSFTGADSASAVKPKVWSFNTIRAELERLINATFTNDSKDSPKPHGFVIDVFLEPAFFIYNVFSGNENSSYYQTYSITGEEITLGNDCIKIAIETKYTLPDGTILNSSTQQVVTDNGRVEGAKNSEETEAARRRVEELRKRILELTEKLYEITGRAKKGNVMTDEDWRKVKKIQDTLDKAKAFVVKEMASIRGVAPVRHDTLEKATRAELLATAIGIDQLVRDYRERLKQAG